MQLSLSILWVFLNYTVVLLLKWPNLHRLWWTWIDGSCWAFNAWQIPPKIFLLLWYIWSFSSLRWFFVLINFRVQTRRDLSCWSLIVGTTPSRPFCMSWPSRQWPTTCLISNRTSIREWTSSRYYISNAVYLCCHGSLNTVSTCSFGL